MLGRAREITQPMKYDIRDDDTLHTSFLNEILNRFLPFKAKLALVRQTWKHSRWEYVMRGLSWDDHVTQDEDQLRRGAVWEHIVRENMHPYHYMITVLRRGAFFKIDHGVDGFETQDEIQNDAKQRYWLRVRPQVLEFYKLWQSYVDDEVPQTFWGHGNYIGVLDFTLFYNLFRRVTWNRYFINEKNVTGTSDYWNGAVPDWQRKKKLSDSTMITQLNKINTALPGLFAPDGQSLDLDQFWKDQLAHPDFRDETGVDFVGTRTIIRAAKYMPEAYKQVETQKEQIDTPNVVGTRISDDFKPHHGTSIM